MTPDQRLAAEWQCARLVALYANLNDEARWEEVAALYTEDGVMFRPTAPDVALTGRAAILAAFKGRSPRKTRHVCSNVVIEVEGPATARGTSGRPSSARSTIASR
jgi:ketosteroid isomerase-like protein